MCCSLFGFKFVNLYLEEPNTPCISSLVSWGSERREKGDLLREGVREGGKGRGKRVVLTVKEFVENLYNS